MAAAQSLDRELVAAARSATRRPLDGEIGFHACRTGTADIDRVIFLGVEVDQQPAFHDRGVEGAGAVEACLLVEGEEQLQRTMLHRRIHRRRHRRSDPQPVVGAERRADGRHPVAVDADPDRVGHEVVGDAVVLLADHIEMSLEHHPGRSFPAGRGRHHDHHVAALVAPDREALLLGPLADVSGDLLLMLRGPRHPADSIEMGPDRPRFQGLQRARHRLCSSTCSVTFREQFRLGVVREFGRLLA